MLQSENALNVSSTQKQESDSYPKLANESGSNDRVYFMSFICNPKILENPHHSKQRFSNILWKDKQIKTIKQLPQYIQITTNQKNQAKKSQPKPEAQKKQLTKEYNLADNQYQKELEGVMKSFNVDYPILKNIFSQRRIDQDKDFEDWLKSMTNKNFVAWYMPMRDNGPMLKKLVISKKTLVMLGYVPQEFSVQIEKYTQLATDFLSGQAYKTLFLSYFISFRKFMSMYVRQDISLEDCVKQSQCTLINQMRGKNDISVKVQMKKYMPSMTVVAYEFPRVVQQIEFRTNQLNQIRNNLTSKSNTKTYNSLSRFAKLPKDINPANTNKICSYVVIRQPSIVQCPISNQKSVKSGSQYQLSES